MKTLLTIALLISTSLVYSQNINEIYLQSDGWSHGISYLRKLNSRGKLFFNTNISYTRTFETFMAINDIPKGFAFPSNNVQSLFPNSVQSTYPTSGVIPNELANIFFDGNIGVGYLFCLDSILKGNRLDVMLGPKIATVYIDYTITRSIYQLSTHGMEDFYAYYFISQKGWHKPFLSLQAYVNFRVFKGLYLGTQCGFEELIGIGYNSKYPWITAKLQIGTKF